MKKLYWNRAVKILSLLLAVVLCMAFLQTFVYVDFWQFAQGPKRVRGFYLEPRNTLDVVLIGDSTVYASYSPGYAYELGGYTSYNYAIGSNPCSTWRTITEEVLRRQDPQLIVVDIGGVQYDDLGALYKRNSTVHTLIDDMPFSLAKLRAIYDLVYREGHDDVLEYLFPFVRYHSDWNWFGDLTYRGREMLFWRYGSRNALKGCVCRAFRDPPGQGALRDVSEDYSTRELTEESEAILRDYLDYCREKDLNVLFVAAPCRVRDEGLLYDAFQRENRAGEIVGEYGYDYVNLNHAAEDMGLDYETDFFNDGHLNYRGQQKYTRYMSALLTGEYGVTPGPLTAAQRQSWEECAEYTRLLYEYALTFEQNQQNQLLTERIEVMQALDTMRAKERKDGNAP